MEECKKAPDYGAVSELLEEGVMVVVPGPQGVNVCHVYCLTDDSTEVWTILTACFGSHKVSSSRQVAMFEVTGRMLVVLPTIQVYLRLHRPKRN